MKNQSGFTLFEVLVVTAIAGVITMGALFTLDQIVLGTGTNSATTEIFTELNRASYYIRKDCQMAQGTNLPVDGTPMTSANFSWSDYSQLASGNFTHFSRYTLSNTNLIRTYDSVPSIIARNIASVNFSQSDRFINVSITASIPRSRVLDRTVSFGTYMRTDEE